MSQCLRCSYDLRASAPDGRCPECGYRVALSLDGVRPHERVRSRANQISFPFLIALTWYGCGTSYSAAVDEPFYRHLDWPHLLRYVIIPTAALVLWAGWAIAVATLLSRRVLPWWWIVLLGWSLVASFSLIAGMELYLRDVIEMGTWDSEPPP